MKISCNRVASPAATHLTYTVTLMHCGRTNPVLFTDCILNGVIGLGLESIVEAARF